MELSIIKKLLNYGDIRSAIKWCAKNEVFIIKQGNKRYVNKGEFILSFYKPFIVHLKNKHKNWREIFLKYINGEWKGLLTTIENTPIQLKKNYKPKSKEGISFLNTLKNL